jgi:hypothetical protein
MGKTRVSTEAVASLRICPLFDIMRPQFRCVF